MVPADLSPVTVEFSREAVDLGTGTWEPAFETLELVFKTVELAYGTTVLVFVTAVL